MEVCPICSKRLVPFRAKRVCRTPGCGFVENCCDGGWMSSGGKPSTYRANEAAEASVVPSRTHSVSDDSRQG
jgi:hypothetical protein